MEAVQIAGRLVIEAAVERETVRRTIFADVKVPGDSAILATNTEAGCPGGNSRRGFYA